MSAERPEYGNVDQPELAPTAPDWNEDVARGIYAPQALVEETYETVQVAEVVQTIPSRNNFHTSNPFVSPSVTEADRAVLRNAIPVDGSQSLDDQIRQIKELVNRHGSDPTKAVTEAIAKNNIVGIGEIHWDDAPHRPWGASQMKTFHEAGITHLAVELPDVLKPVFDKFNSSPKGSDLEIPAALDAPDGDRALAFLQNFREKSNLLALWKEARDAGIAIVPIDNSYSLKDPDSEERAALGPQRDKQMALNISKVLNDEPESKVMAWVGSHHLASGNDDPSAQKTLVEELTSKVNEGSVNASIATFIGTIGHPVASDTSMFSINQELTKPVSVATHADGEPNILGETSILGLPHLFRADDRLRYEFFDGVLMFPETEPLPMPLNDVTYKFMIDFFNGT